MLLGNLSQQSLRFGISKLLGKENMTHDLKKKNVTLTMYEANI